MSRTVRTHGSGRRRQSGTNSGVTGPTSALTSFLREQNIHIPHQARRRRQGEQDNEENEENGNNTDDQTNTTGPEDASTTPSAPSLTTSTSSRQQTPDTSVDLFASTSTNGRSTRSSRVADNENNNNSVASSSASASKSKAKKRKRKSTGSDSDNLDDDDDYVPKPVVSNYSDKPLGSFDYCKECGKKFTLTQYTPKDDDGALCTPCARENGIDIKSKDKQKQAAAARKRKTRTGNPLEKAPKTIIKSLQKSCIEIIGENIEHVENLGDLGALNYQKICKIVCKHRSLSPDNMGLFLATDMTDLKFFDATLLDDEALKRISAYCPNLESVSMFMCGMINDEVLDTWTQRLSKLKNLELYGPFLITADSWVNFLSTRTDLSGFKIRQTARFDANCLEMLCKSSPNLGQLQLSEVGKFEPSWIDTLCTHLSTTSLTHLDLSAAGNWENLDDDSVIKLLAHLGQNLETLILDNNSILSDRTVVEGIKPYCKNLVNLSLGNIVDDLTPESLCSLFSSDWINQRHMKKVSFSRCRNLNDDAINALIDYTGGSLTHLNLNSLDSLTEASLKRIAAVCVSLQEIDVSFVRMFDDFILKEYVDNLTSLETIYIYGDNRVTDDCPRRPDLRIRGREKGREIE